MFMREKNIFDVTVRAAQKHCPVVRTGLGVHLGDIYGA